jgi:uncharacterized DUF497 family protein
LNYNFEWDPSKAKKNLQKHKISFENACTVFTDPNAITIFDVSHSLLEERWITLGFTSNGILIVVHHTFKIIDKNLAIIRIISCRKATKQETKQYSEV